MIFKKQANFVQKGLVAASGVAGYIVLISLFFYHGNRWFGKEDNLLSPIVALSLFVVSALTCALIVLAEPYRLFVDNKGKDALTLVIWTTKWLAVFLGVAIVGAIVW